MRIALVIDYALDYLGGAQSAFLDSARVLERGGHEVAIIAPMRGLADATHGLEGEILGVPARWTLPGVDLPVIRNTAALRDELGLELARLGIEVVHVHSEFGLAAAAVEAAEGLGIRTVQTVHTFYWTATVPRQITRPAAAAVGGFARLLRGFGVSGERLADSPLDAALRGVTHSLATRVDAVVSPSGHQAAALRRAGIGPVAVVPNANAARTPAGAPLGRIDGPLRIAWVGRLVAEKRPEVLAEAALLADRELGAGSIHVEFIGAGPLHRRLRGWRRRGAPIELVGRVPRASVAGRMRRSHLVALTSLGYDNQPVTIIEALHARRGVLVADAALREGLETGAALRPETPDAAGIATLLVELVRDPARVLAASAAAASGGLAFEPERHAAALLAAYGRPVRVLPAAAPSVASLPIAIEPRASFTRARAAVQERASA